MATWLTTHYPKEGIDRNTPWHIYLKEQYKYKADLIHESDLVFFYELKGGKKSGSGLIVRMARVGGGGMRPNIYGYFKTWPWYIPCVDLRRGQVPADELDKILGKPFFPLIPGGIRRLSEIQADQLCKEFVSERRP